MTGESVYTFAKWRVKDGERATVLSLLAELRARSLAEEGNLAYEVHESSSDESVLILFEGYRDESALAEHRQSEHYQKLVAGKILPLLEDREIVVTTRVEFSS